MLLFSKGLLVVCSYFIFFVVFVVGFVGVYVLEWIELLGLWVFDVELI